MHMRVTCTLHLIVMLNVVSMVSLLCSMSQIRERVKKEDTQLKSKSAHHSQSDSAKGYGGTYGVQNDRQDKASCLF